MLPHRARRCATASTNTSRTRNAATQARATPRYADVVLNQRCQLAQPCPSSPHVPNPTMNPTTSATNDASTTSVASRSLRTSAGHIPASPIPMRDRCGASGSDSRGWRRFTSSAACRGPERQPWHGVWNVRNGLFGSRSTSGCSFCSTSVPTTTSTAHGRVSVHRIDPDDLRRFAADLFEPPASDEGIPIVVERLV